jgi:hypothetical protein
MGVHFIVLAVAPLLLLGGTSGEGKRDSVDEGQEVEARYRPLGDGRQELSGTVRYAPTKNIEVGWQIVVQHYGQQAPVVTGWHVAIGPLWAFGARLRSGAAGFRGEFDPWVGVTTSFVEKTSGTPVRVTDGADFSAQLYGSVRLAKGLRISPGVSIMTKAARSSTPIRAFWDRQTGWRFLLPVWLGTQRRLRVEVAYTKLSTEGVYFGHERWTFVLAKGF